MKAVKIAPGVYIYTIARFVNVFFLGEAGGAWAVIDTGTAGKFEEIKTAAEEIFGTDIRPDAIYLTHGHGDHSGSALALATYWDVPIYVHPLELPFVTGKSAYPPPDLTVDGVLAFLTRFSPTEIVDLGDWVQVLPLPGEPLPGLADWEILETPGHAPGHLSFFRERDKTLIAGDAFSTLDMDTLTGIFSGAAHIYRPPKPTTSDWIAARRSLRLLAERAPFLIAAGHGAPMHGLEVAGELYAFAEDFIAPLHGRYVSDPARTDESGILYLPPPAPDPLPKIALGLGIGAAAIAVAAFTLRKRKNLRKGS